MNNPVELQRHGDVALVVIDNPPVNVITKVVRAGLQSAIAEADEESAARTLKYSI